MKGKRETMRFIIEKGYIKALVILNGAVGREEKSGWVADDNGSLYAVVRVDEHNSPIGEAKIALELGEIPEIIRQIMEEVQ